MAETYPVLESVIDFNETGFEQHRQAPLPEEPFHTVTQNVFIPYRYQSSPTDVALQNQGWLPQDSQQWEIFDAKSIEPNINETPLRADGSHDDSSGSDLSPFEINHSIKSVYPNSNYFSGRGGSAHFNFYALPAIDTSQQRNPSQIANQLSPHYENPYASQLSQHNNGNRSDMQPQLDMIQDTRHPHVSQYSGNDLDFRQKLEPTWPTILPENDHLNCQVTPSTSPFMERSSLSVKLHWPGDVPIEKYTVGPSSNPISLPKRKRASPQPAKRARPSQPEKEMSEFVVVFENAPGALSAVKHRRKLDAPVRKAARDVRKAGACHQCRFRKRTCSTGSPCISCLKNGNGLHEVKCQRESPFVGKFMHRYFEFSSTKRIVSFGVKLKPKLCTDSSREIVTVDGIGTVSYPIQLCAQRKSLSHLNTHDQEVVQQTSNIKTKLASKHNPDVVLLEDDSDLPQNIEQWAVEYTSKFVYAAGSEFYPTTMAQILGTAYVKKGLPESKLVATMLRVASLAFILRAGVKYSTSNSKSRSDFRTVQARVDTVLYERLQLAEKELFQILQRLIFRTAGCLTRVQIFPVALVLWQLMRILSISSSHLSNIAHKFHSSAHAQADYQFIGLRQLLSTHMALFRSSNPLLLDMKDKLNSDLVGHDEELITLCGKMRKVVVTFREKGLPKMKGSIAYKKEYFDMSRRVYKGL